MSKKVSQKKGFTLVEMLCTVVLVLLMSALVSMGFRLALESMDDTAHTSEAQILCSTLATKIYKDIYDGGKTAENFGYIGDEESADEEVTVKPLSDGSSADCPYIAYSDGRVVVPRKAYPAGMRASLSIKLMPEAGEHAGEYRVQIDILNKNGTMLAHSYFYMAKKQQ